jgi:hypothetical protein
MTVLPSLREIIPVVYAYRPSTFSHSSIVFPQPRMMFKTPPGEEFSELFPLGLNAIMPS